MPTPAISESSDELLLVVASSAAFSAAGLDIGLIEGVICCLPSPSDAANAGAGSLPKIVISRLRTANFESVDEMRLQLVQMSQALKAIRQMPQEEIEAIVQQLQPAVDGQDHHSFKHGYGSLTVEEMADRMKCTPEMVREREVAGEFFAALPSSRADGPLYPQFQLDDRLDKSLLKQVIKEYRDAGVSTTLLWSFLRSPQKIFADFTPMEMMLGASPADFAPLTPEEWSEAFLDVVAEELSRVR